MTWYDNVKDRTVPVQKHEKLEFHDVHVDWDYWRALDEKDKRRERMSYDGLAMKYR